eukprot:g4080.t1 g4080   contig15:297891-299459(+)
MSPSHPEPSTEEPTINSKRVSEKSLNTMTSTNTSATPSGLSISSITDSNAEGASGSDTHSKERTNYYYLTPNAVSKLPNYQYHGRDMSLLYKHVLSPLAGWLVDNVTPVWLAPNSITLFGLAWMILSYSVIFWYCPGLYEGNTNVHTDGASNNNNSRSGVPEWIFLLNCIAMLTYQTLDNMDGKQARKTGSSSPLGLLFDHGCDAINSILGSANWIAAMGLFPSNINGEYSGGSIVSEFFGGDATLAALLILCPMIAFYISTWEQYYTGELILPPFNGPSEGLLLGASLSLISWGWGVMFWQETGFVDGSVELLRNSGLGESMKPVLDMVYGRVRNMDLIVLSTVLALFQEVTLKVLFVIRGYGISTLRTILPHAMLVISTLVLINYDDTVMLRRPRTVMHLVSGLFVEQTTQLMLDHMVEEEYKVLKRFCMYPMMALALAAFDGGLVSVEATDAFLLAYATGVWVYLAFKIRVQIYEICDVLGIWCFDIVTPYYSEGVNAAEGEGIVGTTVPVDMTTKKVN